MPDWIVSLLQLLALPEVGLSTVFVVAFLSATLLPMGSEPAVFALIKLSPELFWPVILVATAGNTLGGAVSWAMGLGAHNVVDKARHTHTPHPRALRWLDALWDAGLLSGHWRLRDFHARLKDLKAGKGYCVTAGVFSDEAKKFVEARLIDLIEKEKLMNFLNTIDSRQKGVLIDE